MNKVALLGRLVRDPELKFTPGNGTEVCTFTLAVPRYNKNTGENEADFIPIVVWNKPAESAANYLVKGSQVAICGRIQTRTYDAKDGSKRHVTEVVADAYGGVHFVGSKGNTNNTTDTSKYEKDNQAMNDVFGEGYYKEDITPIYDDDNMPFN